MNEALLLALLTVGARASDVPASTRAASAAAVPPYDESWVSYFRGSDRVQWGVFDPVTGLETVFQELDAYPSNILWSPSFDRVLYRIGSEIFDAPWKPGAEPVKTADLPQEAAGLDAELLVSSPTGRLRLGVLISAPAEQLPAGFGAPYRARVWEREPGGSWTLLRDRLTSVGAGENLGLSVVSEDLRTGWIRAEPNPLDFDRLDWLHRGSDGAGEAFLSSRTNKKRGLRLRVEAGNQPGFKTPIVFQDRYSGQEKTLKGLPPCADRLAFSRNGDYLLVASEELGRCACVVGLGSGLFRCLPADSRWAAWVRPLRR